MAAERRRETLRKRRAVLATGAVMGAAAVFAPMAHAANFEVQTTGDDTAVTACDSTGHCANLRDALDAANNNGEADTITFTSGLSGTIRLKDVLDIADDGGLVIDGGDASRLTVSGDVNGDDDPNDSSTTSDNVRVFDIASSTAVPVTIKNLTLADGYADGDGGAIYADSGSDLTVSHSVIKNSHVTGDGGAISSVGYLSVADSVVSGNSAEGTGGGILGNGLSASVSSTEISGNSAGDGGGGIQADTALRLRDSRVTGNTTDGNGGGIQRSSKYSQLNLADSTISGNTATGNGGGIAFSTSTGPKYATNISSIDRTTISGNKASNGAGFWVGSTTDAETIQITGSTLSGNQGDEGSFGGGLMVKTIRGHLDVNESTISGNSAGTGAGASVGDDSNTSAFLDDNASVTFHNSTVAANIAATTGGGIYLGTYGMSTVELRESALVAAANSASVSLNSTIVANNNANGADQDLDRGDGSGNGGFTLAYSLVEQPGDAPLTGNPGGSNITGTDPQLGALGDNGGPTATMLPAATSPVIDQGVNETGAKTDQRGLARIEDGSVANPKGGDGTDIGAVERQRAVTPAPPVIPPAPPEPEFRNKTDKRPTALIKKNRLYSTNDDKRIVRGIAFDDHKVTKVDVAIVNKRNGKCRQLLKSLEWSSYRKCGRTSSFLPAEGTTKWSYKLKKQLEAGYYVVYSRAHDGAGQRQFLFGEKSRRAFIIK
jgi:parallel beta-helix repeat protein/predicted outer membrane repeat protein